MIRTRLPDPRPQFSRSAGDVVVPDFGDALSLANVRAAFRGRQRVWRHPPNQLDRVLEAPPLYVVADVR